MASRVIRVTMFKLPSTETATAFKGLYTTLSKTAVKDGSPYILSLEAGPTINDPLSRSQGWNFVAKSEFRSIEDMWYYDKECAAHQTLKAGTQPLGVKEVMTVFYEPAVVGKL